MQKQKITPFLWFDTQCEEAMKFYVEIFSGRPGRDLASGGKNSRIVSIKRYPEGPLEEPMKGMEGKVLTAKFELEGQEFLALDGGPFFKPTAAVSFYIECKDQKEVDHYWNKLGEGGDPKMQQCGWVQDKYGFSWQVIPEALPRLLTDLDKEKADRVLKAMLAMKKIDVAKLEEAAKE